MTFQDSFDGAYDDDYQAGGPLDPNDVLPSVVETPRPRNEQVFNRLYTLSQKYPKQHDGKYLIDITSPTINLVLTLSDIEVGVSSRFLEQISDDIYEFDSNKNPRDVARRNKEWVESFNKSEQ